MDIRCKKCKENKEEREFYRNPGNKNGRNTKCIACLRAERSKYPKCAVCGGKVRNGNCIDCLLKNGQKQCRKCKEIKGVEEFYEDQSKRDRKTSRCRTCLRPTGATSSTPKQHLHSFIPLQGVELGVRNKKNTRYRNEYARLHNKIQRQNNIGFRIKCNLRGRIYTALKKQKKVGSAVKDLGCTVEQLKQHLEILWLPGMSWNNYGRFGWCIDHIVPLALFDLTDPIQFKKACHYTNLQPLWNGDHFKKTQHDIVAINNKKNQKWLVQNRGATYLQVLLSGGTTGSMFGSGKRSGG